MSPAETTGAWAVAKFEHDSSRPVDGYAAPQLHTHAVVFNMTEDSGRQHAGVCSRRNFTERSSMQLAV